MKAGKCCGILMLVVLMAVTQALAGETWKITSLDWEPYCGASLANQGNSIQKLRVLLEKEGINLLVEFYPWKRAQQLAMTKDYVGYFPAWPEEVGDGFFASPAVDWSEIGILKKAGTQTNFNTIEELFQNNKVGIVKTYVYPKDYSDAMAEFPANVDAASDEMSLLKKLSVGRTQFAITDPLVMTYLAQKNGISDIETAKVIEKKELVIAFRNGSDNQKRLEILNALLAK